MNQSKTVWRDKLKHAFAVKQDKLVLKTYLPLLDKVAKFIAQRRLQAPAILALQSLIPLNFIGSQALIVVSPFLDPFLTMEEQNKIIELLEHRDGIELLIQRIETLSREGSLK